MLALDIFGKTRADKDFLERASKAVQLIFQGGSRSCSGCCREGAGVDAGPLDPAAPLTLPAAHPTQQDRRAAWAVHATRPLDLRLAKLEMLNNSDGTGEYADDADAAAHIDRAPSSDDRVDGPNDPAPSTSARRPSSNRARAGNRGDPRSRLKVRSPGQASAPPRLPCTEARPKER